MNMEQLQAMSDPELNELSAVKVMGYTVVKQEGFIDQIKVSETKNYSIPWNPTTDMNDAMELWNKLHLERWELSLSCDHKITTPWDCRMFLLDGHDITKRVIVHEKTASRAITIASILAKEGTE